MNSKLSPRNGHTHNGVVANASPLQVANRTDWKVSWVNPTLSASVNKYKPWVILGFTACYQVSTLWASQRLTVEISHRRLCQAQIETLIKRLTDLAYPEGWTSILQAQSSWFFIVFSPPLPMAHKGLSSRSWELSVFLCEGIWEFVQKADCQKKCCLLTCTTQILIFQ